MPLGGGGHRGSALAGGKADHPALRYAAQMLRQHDIGMRGGNCGVEDRAQERASVGHGAPSEELNDMTPLSILIAAKENPRKRCSRG